jgi:hypothetical protein
MNTWLNNISYPPAEVPRKLSATIATSENSGGGLLGRFPPLANTLFMGVLLFLSVSAGPVRGRRQSIVRTTCSRQSRRTFRKFRSAISGNFS